MAHQSMGANSAVEGMLDEHLKALGEGFKADPLALYGPIDYRLDDIVRDAVEPMREGKTDSGSLVVVLDTDGGYLDVARRIVDTFRYHYQVVSFVIPNAAYSAGTILAMSGDAIYMDYYSRLGPIDPQAQGENGRMVPRGGQKPRFDHAAASWYSWTSPPSRSRRRTSRGSTGIGSPAATGEARARAR